MHQWRDEHDVWALIAQVRLEVGALRNRTLQPAKDLTYPTQHRRAGGNPPLTELQSPRRRAFCRALTQLRRVAKLGQQVSQIIDRGPDRGGLAVQRILLGWQGRQTSRD